VATAPVTGETPKPVRKVRTAQGTVLDNLQAEQSDGKCNRKIPPGGKDEGRRMKDESEKAILLFILHPSIFILLFR
jgi:hypothetical protein